MPRHYCRLAEHVAEINLFSAMTQMRKIDESFVEVFYLDAKFVYLFDLQHELFHFLREELLTVRSDAAEILMTEDIVPFIIENFFEPRDVFKDGDDILYYFLRFFERKVFCVLVHVLSSCEHRFENMSGDTRILF